jgi:O-antigen/teichoic acid export membrane protein
LKRQAAWLLISRGSGSLCQAVLLALFARAVVPAVFGQANSVMGIAVFFGVIADFGLSTYVVKVHAIDNDLAKVASALRANRYSTVIFAALLSIAYLALAIPLGLNLWLVLVIIWVALDKNVEAQMSVFIARRANLTIAISIGTRRLIPILLFLGLSALKLDPELAFGASLVSGLIVGEIHMTRALRHAFSARDEKRIAVSKTLREALPYSLANVTSQARNLDTAIVSLAASAAAAGLFAASSKTAIPVFLVAAAVATSIMPAVASGGLGFSRRLLWALLGGLVIGCLATLAFLPLAGEVMSLIYGTPYSSAGGLLVLVVIGTLFAAATSPLATLTQAHGGAGPTALIGLIFAPVLLLSLLVAAYFDGAYGAAWAGLAVQAARTVVMVVLLLRFLRIEHPAESRYLQGVSDS